MAAVLPKAKTLNKLQRALARLGRYTGPLSAEASPRFLRAVQTHLKFKGEYDGPIDGTLSNDTSKAVQRFVRDRATYTGAINGTLTEEVWESYLNLVRQINQSKGDVTEAFPTFTNTTLPAISGTAQVGQTLTVSNGTWSETPDSYTRQWFKNGTAISGATNATYTLVSGDQGATITAKVTAVKDGFTSVTATSAATSAVAAA